ncbi:MAG: FGGY family carbohydrate kinase [Candidatus Marinimicrobia bacterium]|nr:FGGY family carbohydrate kinase [Candidatus Neomarinimicrobiota bacterium]
MPSAVKPFTLVIDQGTSATKVFLFNSVHRAVFKSRLRHSLNNSKPGHVEADALKIARSCEKLIRETITYAKNKNIYIASAGIAVQRSTFLFWDRNTIKPLTPTLSWQDGRATDIVEKLKPYSESIFKISGAPLNPHFGGPKFTHLINRSTSLKNKIEDGSAVFGTISAFITHYLTGNCLVDETVASRFIMMNLDTCEWDQNLLNLFGVPKNCLPQLVSSESNYGSIKYDDYSIPLQIVIGDQQAALIGQGGFKTGSVAMNFGTSGSVQINAGQQPAHIDGLISSVLFSNANERLYLLEGTVNACNALFYTLEDELDIPHKEMQWSRRCTKTETNGVYVPSAIGIAAPYWIDHLKTVSEGYGKDLPNEIIRAGMESIGFLVNDIWNLVKTHLNIMPKSVMASGGGARNPLLQFISDLTGLTVTHSIMKDRTALGVHALLNQSLTGSWPNIKIDSDGEFTPKINVKKKDEKIARWKIALKKAGVL